MANAFEFTVYARTNDFQFTLRDDNNEGVAIEAGDVVRFKLGRGDNSVPDLDLRSGGATANGSTITVDQTTAPAKATVRIAQDDVADLVPGTYRGELLLVDDSETAPVDAIKHAALGVVYVIGGLGGNVNKST